MHNFAIERSPPASNSSLPIALGQTPLTDPRSLGSSARFHALLLLLASLTAVNIALLIAQSFRPKALYAELDPVDNRASVPPALGEGGGGPGDIGGMSSLPFVPPADGPKPQGVTRDPMADTLLADILPSSQPTPSETLQRAVPEPQTIGQGLIPGSGSGGGGGAGGGSGGGAGVELDPVPSSSARAIMLTPSPMSSTVPAAWPPATHSMSQNAKYFPASTSFPPMPNLR